WRDWSSDVCSSDLPFARRVAQLRKAFLVACRNEDIIAIAKSMIEKAKEGDAAAAKLVLAYGLGKPAETVDPDRLDIEEWNGFKETSHMMCDMKDMVLAPDPLLPLC